MAISWPLHPKRNWNINQKQTSFIEEFIFEATVQKMAAIFCSAFNVLTR